MTSLVHEGVEYRPTPRYPFLYVSADGRRVISLRWGDPRQVQLSPPLNYSRRRRGLQDKTSQRARYWHVRIRVAGRARVLFIHHMVLEAWARPRPVGMLACHWDDDKDNNALDNLYYGREGDNKRDAIRNGRARRPVCDLTPKQVEAVRWLRARGFTQTQVATLLEVSRSRVRRAELADRWEGQRCA